MNAPDYSLRQRKKQQQRARVLAAATARVNHQGWRETTVAQIAADAGISEATFFNYFGSKEALLGELAAGIFDYYEQVLAEVSATAADAPTAIRAFFQQAAQIIGRSESLSREVLLEVMRNTANSPGQRAHHGHIHAHFRTLIQQGQRDGILRTDYPAGFLAEMVTAALNEVITHWLMTPDYPLRECLDQASRFITGAIQAR